MNNKTTTEQSGSDLERSILEHLKSRPVAIRRIAKFIVNRYASFVDMRDLETASPEGRLERIITRCLAAHAACVFAGLAPDDAAATVVDGGQDLGLDAIAIDERQKCCWLFQAKLQQSGRGLIEWGEMAKFLSGFDAIISESFAHANRKILAMTQDLRRAANEPGWRFVLVLATTSEDPLTEKCIETIKGHLAYQDPGNSGTFTFENFTLSLVTKSIEKAFDAAQINLKIELHDWGCVTDPFTAYYGRVSVGSIIQWRQVGPTLFEKNLRNFEPSSQVAESIARTLAEQSHLFWYFNNGATILCETIKRHGPYSTSKSREAGHFECTGVSVVNGAQTIGTIWGQPQGGADLDPRSMVHLRLISLEGAPPDFAQQVTKATNTQKAILARDFATLDAAQRKLCREFQMDGRTYVFRQGDQAPSPADGCTIEEASVALACSESVELATIAYRNPGFLIDPDNPVYKQIFREKLTAEETWLAVKILRVSDLALSKYREEARNGRNRQVATHGRRYIQFRVFNDSQVKSLRGPAGQKEEDLQRIVSEAASAHFQAVLDYITQNHDGEYLQVLFKNTQKVKRMEESLSPPAQWDQGQLRQRSLIDWHP